MKKGILISHLALGFLMLLSAHAMAQGGRIQIGKTKVIPGISLQEVYDDNIYLVNDNEESDWITHVMPALGGTYSFEERGSLSLGYAGDLAYYSDNDKNDWQTHKGMFNLDYEAPGGLILGISNTYTDAEDPYGSPSQYKLGVPKTERWNNDGKGKIGYNFGNRLKALAYYNYYKQDYDLAADYTQDYDDNEFGLGFQIRMLPKTWGFIRYHYGERDYFTNKPADNVTEATDSDFDWSRVNVGLTWDTGAKLSGEVNFGYQWKDYDNISDPGRNRYEDKDTWIAGTAVNYTATATTTLSLSIARALRESGSNTNEFFEDTGFGLSLKQILFTKFTLDLSGTYSKNDYNLPVAKKKEHDNYLASLGLDYRIQDWLSAGVSYKYMEKESNYPQDEFTDNQFMISLRGVY